MSTPPLRTIIEDDSFTSAFGPLRISYGRLDEALTGVSLSLCQYPDRYPKIPGTVLSIIKTREFPGIPPLRIFFTYTNDEVHLRHVEIIQQGGEAQESAEDEAEDEPEEEQERS